MDQCPSSALDDFNHRLSRSGIKSQMLRVNGLTLGNAILAGILVGIGTYGTRYRHRAFIRVLFQGASTMFLPILSYVASSASATVSTFGQTVSQYRNDSGINTTITTSGCSASVHLFLALIWAGLVHIVGINTCTTIATSDREGRNMGLPMVLLVQVIWTSYLVVSLTPNITDILNLHPSSLTITLSIHRLFTYSFLPIIFALIYCKVALRYYELQKARRSVVLGRNPPLIVGYMEQLQEENKCGIAPAVQHCPPLIVLGEDRPDIEKGAHGLFFKPRMCLNQDAITTTNNTGLVTIDKVWMLDDNILTSAPWLKDVCISFAFFKLFRCRFAGYSTTEAGFQEVYGFLHVLLKDNDHERLYGVITGELSFLHDYYYTSIPIHYSNFRLPLLNIFISLLTILYCFLLVGMGMPPLIEQMLEEQGQVVCLLYCLHTRVNNSVVVGAFGNLVFDFVPVAILTVLVVLAEAREIVSYICSNWTKVALICHYVVNNHGNWKGSPRMQKWIGCVLRCRFKLLKHWDDKMNQCSVLMLHPRRTDQIFALLMRLLHLPDRKRNVKVPRVVKAAIVDAVRSNNNGLLAGPAEFLRRSPEHRSTDFLWACKGKGIADIILIWHIATGILGVRRQQHPPSEDMIVATHLSRYCAYLVAYMPDLLPDYDKWSKGLYMAVKKDSMRALAGRVALSAAESEYNDLVTSLQERAENEVLRNGVKLGKQLAELPEPEGEAAAWRLLAGFWSQMILYMAPSDNLNGHADAIARGGELISFVWALLMHVGITSRPNAAGAPATGDRV